MLDAYLVKFDGAGNRLWATYYGASGIEDAMSVATDASGNVFTVGLTSSADSIASNGFENIYLGSNGGFMMMLAKFDNNGNRQCATYYAQLAIKYDGNTTVAVDNAGNVYVEVSVASPDSTCTSGGFQDIFYGTEDAILVKFCPCSNCTIIPIAGFQSSDTTFCSYNCINYTDMSTNTTSWQWTFPGASPSSSTVQNPQGICYDTAGTFDATLIASNSGYSDTLTFTNFIKVLASPPTPVIIQHDDTLFCSTDPSYTAYQWYDNSILIPGATDTFLVVTHGDNYNVAVNNEFGCQISVGITIVLGIQNYTIDNLFSLSPNPANQSIVISLQSAVNKKIEITIIDVLGQEVLSFPHLLWRGAGGEALDISKLPAGMYFLQMKTESAIDTKRFVKE